MSYSDQTRKLRQNSRRSSYVLINLAWISVNVYKFSVATEQQYIFFCWQFSRKLARISYSSIMRSLGITLISLALTCIVIGNAYYQKKQFYPSVVYITKSNPSMAVRMFIILFHDMDYYLFILCHLLKNYCRTTLPYSLI